MRIFILTLLFVSASVFATPVDDAKSVMQTLAGKNLSNATMLSIATKYSRAHNFSNPWDPVTNPDEHATWPTGNELATFFLQRVRNQIRSDIGSIAGRDHDVATQADRDAAVIAAQGEL